MAYLEHPTRIRNNGSSVYQRGFYWFNTGSGSPLYIHMKTNIPRSSNYMFYIEAEGYNYGVSAPVLCSWTGYPYSGTGTLINYDFRNHYTGMSADGAYQSSDNYIVLRAYAGSNYYNGFILNAIMANPNGHGFEVSIQASVQTDQSGAYY